MKWDINKFVVIIHGNIRIPIEIIEKSWEGFNIIWSTWSDQEINTKNAVIYNNYPNERGVGNLELQRVAIQNGLILAKKLGYETAIKWRTDQHPTNAKALFSLFDFNYLNFLFWHNYGFGYYADYFIAGKIEDILLLYNFEKNEYPYAEFALFEQIKRHQLKTNCIGQSLTEDNDIIWKNRNPDHKLSSYKNDKLFSIKNIM